MTSQQHKAFQTILMCVDWSSRAEIEDTVYVPVELMARNLGWKEN